ncbi:MULTISPECIES: helix-turn-helix domain-containing protein [Leuconostoc]|uniref:helix-turn-helix domain-containing protein n=1 Tax=Leuconostoc TaxID=1243 RepID=UPI000D506C4A|nr:MULTISPECIES: helix-turn-helix transcriptional regulator [Leuconostoc]KAA8326179.1 helix-turn-helix transcriptional regulator [Leuconostoc carnosum]KAA8368135.1 helix-turn-helix transcriptional regulator [Leuconostoc carnosum]KAA8373393.1 helix-turn-helix transcriptional regulator [Leuconostoc carnosum]KAA8375978.1 helix-turn-helix transcriptional regulator [Leuconostoc carnosum]KAA8378641.1 helix-turn-helix transcriptional regulator [Leuconostoc carnosum]
MTLVSRTKEVAKKRGIPLKKLALKAGLAENAIYRWDTNNPKSENLEKVADILNVSTDYLLERTDDMNLSNTDSKTEMDIKDALEHDIMLAFDGKPISEKYKRIILELLSEEDD